MIKVRHLRVCVCWCWLLCLFIVPCFSVSPPFLLSLPSLSPSSPEAKAEAKAKKQIASYYNDGFSSNQSPDVSYKKYSSYTHTHVPYEWNAAIVTQQQTTAIWIMFLCY